MYNEEIEKKFQTISPYQFPLSYKNIAMYCRFNPIIPFHVFICTWHFNISVLPPLARARVATSLPRVQITSNPRTIDLPPPRRLRRDLYCNLRASRDIHQSTGGDDFWNDALALA